MPGLRERPVDRPPADLASHRNRYLTLGLRLQLILRLLLVLFIAITLAIEPPRDKVWVCVLVIGIYLAVVSAWTIWAFFPRRAHPRLSGPVAFLVLLADVGVVATLTAVTGITSPDSWTSDVLQQGLFLIPIIAAGQLSPKFSAATAFPTVAALLVASSINKSVNQEPWAAIIMNAAVLCGLAGGSIALSFIQRSRVAMIRDLLGQRTQLLDELLGVEKQEQAKLSERLHDGALQSVLAARYDIREIRTGSAEAIDRADSALSESVHLLRDVVRELHPEVLNRSGLRAAVEQLAHNVGERADLVVDLDVDGWPEGVTTDLDRILFSCAREITNNVVKHANATRMRIGLNLGKALARLQISDDGSGMSDVDLAGVVEAGHIGLAAVRTKVAAAGGEFDITSGPGGTEVTVTIPLRRAT